MGGFDSSRRKSVRARQGAAAARRAGRGEKNARGGRLVWTEVRGRVLAARADGKGHAPPAGAGAGLAQKAALAALAHSVHAHAPRASSPSPASPPPTQAPCVHG